MVPLLVPSAFVVLLNAAPLAPSSAAHAALRCVASQKMDWDRRYSPQELEQSQFSVRIVELPTGALISRCSFAPSEGRVTCDEYVADRVEVDANVGIKKFYLFRSQFDVQVFPDLTFLENNGRGSVAFGRCTRERTASVAPASGTGAREPSKPVG